MQNRAVRAQDAVEKVQKWLHAPGGALGQKIRVSPWGGWVVARGRIWKTTVYWIAYWCVRASRAGTCYMSLRVGSTY